MQRGGILNSLGLTVELPVLILGVGFLIWHFSRPGTTKPDIEVLKVMFGFLLLLVVVGIGILLVRNGASINADEKESFQSILLILSGLASAFGLWAFAKKDDK